MDDDSRPLMKTKLLSALVLTLLLTTQANAATYTAASMASADIQAAINAEAAANPGGLGGDIILVPNVPFNGNVTWTPGGIQFTNPITLQGPGTNGQCFAYYSDIGNSTPSWTVTCIAAFTTNSSIIGTNEWRITGFEIVGITNGGPSPGGKGAIQFIGNGYNMRFDHNLMTNCNDWMVCTYGVCGVIDHNTFINKPGTIILEWTAENWSGFPNGTGPYANFADGSWAAPTGLGTSNFMFAEDNMFIPEAGGSLGIAACDATAGGRIVMRHNTMTNGLMSLHGTETGGLARGPRAFEFYLNTNYQTINADHPVNLRAGTGVCYSNQTIYVLGGSCNPYYQEVCCYGSAGYYPDWGAFNGTNLLCKNSTNSDGSPVVYAAFTCSNTSVTTPVSSPYYYTVAASVASPNWIVDQWRGYSIVDTSEPIGTSQVNYTNFSLVTHNTSNSISFMGNTTGTSATTVFNAGDACVLYLQQNVIDMPGMGQCTGWVRDPITTMITNNAIALAQAIEPIYTWSNVINGAPVGTTNVYAVVRPGVHFIDGTPAPGYTPYPYPHPLVSGAPPPSYIPAPPTNLRVVAR